MRSTSAPEHALHVLAKILIPVQMLNSLAVEEDLVYVPSGTGAFLPADGYGKETRQNSVTTAIVIKRLEFQWHRPEPPTEKREHRRARHASVFVLSGYVRSSKRNVCIVSRG